MFNKNNEVVYVGQTSNIDSRISSHQIFNKDVYDYPHVTTIPIDKLNEIKYVKFAKVQNKYLSSIYELHFITKYLPVYNKATKYYSKTLLDLPKLSWYKYIHPDEYKAARFHLCSTDLKYKIKDPIERSVLYKEILSQIESEEKKY